MTLSEPRPFRKHTKKRRDYIQQKLRGTMYMTLFTFTSVAQIVRSKWFERRNQKKKNLLKPFMIIQLRTPLILPKTLLNKVPNCLWLPLM